MQPLPTHATCKITEPLEAGSLIDVAITFSVRGPKAAPGAEYVVGSPLFVDFGESSPHPKTLQELLGASILQMTPPLLGSFDTLAIS
jgi:hypothetical protein